MAERLSVPDLEERIAAAFRRAGAGSVAARSVARALVAAEADGLKGHGLSRLASYLDMLRSGKVDGKAVPVASRPRPAILAIDAANGFAYPALDLAIAELPAIARTQGIATAPIRRSNHCGVAGHHAERLAEAGFVALVFANTPSAIAPWGGHEPAFGTNPVAFAAPLAGRAPVVVDLSVSKVARGNVIAAKQKGERIPEGWALDAQGRPTTDPEAALAGTMVPMGGAKGAALAFMVETLVACLVGANLAFEASTFFDGKGLPPETGQLVIAFDPMSFGHDRFAERLTTLCAMIEGQAGARLPGARRLALREAAAREGIAVSADIAGLLAG
ncbi:(2R)-3-sulfolactate dehydrogenase (NADP+) [Rhizobiales bacterium GAS191]|jgi:(2R)-3-sulfolactate dehydrogenase (NADP+)|nr:(2R)-3-sulfolactate dehydrogenase (NADP+) [Rhizobiales bacterium GAS113]SEB88478.1 (2R)-3-sulfolactate dehydrogenase (NADP+) [Rhizobiales bacterium GAS191]SED29116.1 (2R)-3-sulfolactate dehydrogenase (NADP+) [Rhizobiales bacterium GAS188]